MLVLSRTDGQEIVIGNNIVITTVECLHGKVKLGITAPREIPVHRKEVADAIKTKVLLAQHEGPPEADGGPVSPPILAATEAFDHSQFDDGGVPPDLSKLGITFKPTQPR